MLKIRLQGKIKDIQWFQRILRNSTDIHISEISDMYSNKGTSQHYRNYMEIDPQENQKGEE